jgi:hypothetical protein
MSNIFFSQSSISCIMFSIFSLHFSAFLQQNPRKNKPYKYYMHCSTRLRSTSTEISSKARPRIWSEYNKTILIQAAFFFMHIYIYIHTYTHMIWKYLYTVMEIFSKPEFNNAISCTLSI